MLKSYAILARVNPLLVIRDDQPARARSQFSGRRGAIVAPSVGAPCRVSMFTGIAGHVFPHRARIVRAASQIDHPSVSERALILILEGATVRHDGGGLLREQRCPNGHGRLAPSGRQADGFDALSGPCAEIHHVFLDGPPAVDASRLGDATLVRGRNRRARHWMRKKCRHAEPHLSSLLLRFYFSAIRGGTVDMDIHVLLRYAPGGCLTWPDDVRVP